MDEMYGDDLVYGIDHITIDGKTYQTNFCSEENFLTYLQRTLEGESPHIIKVSTIDSMKDVFINLDNIATMEVGYSHYRFSGDEYEV